MDYQDIAGSCPITLEGDLTPQRSRLRIGERPNRDLNDHCRAVYEGVRGTIVRLAGRRRGTYSNCPKALPFSAAICQQIGRCFRSLSYFRRLRPRHLLIGRRPSSHPVHQWTTEIRVVSANLRAQRFFPVTSAKDLGITPPDSMNGIEHNPAGRSVEPGGHTDADAHSNRGTSSPPKLGALASLTTSLAGVSDGSGPARCIHGVGMRVRRVV